MGEGHRSGDRTGARRGLSFVEILVAITILTFALLPLLYFMRTGSRGVQGTRDIAAAAYLAGQALESLRSWRFDELAEEDPADPDGKPSAEAVFQEDEFRLLTVGKVRFEREVDVVPLEFGPGGPEVKLARVRVRWRRGETPLVYEVSTVISRAP